MRASPSARARASPIGDLGRPRDFGSHGEPPAAVLPSSTQARPAGFPLRPFSVSFSRGRKPAGTNYHVKAWLLLTGCLRQRRQFHGAPIDARSIARFGATASGNVFFDFSGFLAYEVGPEQPAPAGSRQPIFRQGARSPMSAPKAPIPRPGVLDIAPYVPGRSKATGGARRCTSSRRTRRRSARARRRSPPIAHRPPTRWSVYPDGGATRAARRDRRRATASTRTASSAAPAPTSSSTSSPTPISARATRRSTPSTASSSTRSPSARSGGTPVVAPETDLTADVDAILARVTERTRVVFLANPNNPTGTYLPFRRGAPAACRAAAARAARARRGLCRICPPQRLRERHRACRQRADNVVMTRTFSKIYGLAGLRIGWGYGPAACHRRAEPHPRAVQRVGAGDRGRRRGARRPRPRRDGRRAQRIVAAEGDARRWRRSA